MSKLKAPEIRAEITEELNNRRQEAPISANSEVESTWTNIKSIFVETTKAKIPTSTRIIRRKWMTNEILDLMEKRRLQKGGAEYQRINREIRTKIRRAKESWLSQECQVIEDLAAKHDTFGMHKKIKEAAGVYRKRQSGILVNGQEETIIDVRDRMKKWCNYINTVFEDHRPDCMRCFADGLDITKEEVHNAITLSKNGKAVGPDEIYSEVIKVLKDEESLTVIVKFFNLIYQKGIIPSDWLKSTFVTLPKKNFAKKCSDYRLISLMSHFLKIFLKIIHRTIYSKCEAFMGDTQFGFRNGFGTREALFTIQVLVQRCRDMSVPVFACFIDYEKAFDRVQHHKLMEILQEVGLEGRDMNIIATLYWNQTAQIKVDDQLSDAVNIRRGVRQGCILSPLLFNLYSSKICETALQDCDVGISINGININNLRYADDTVIIANSLTGLQTLLDRVAVQSAAYGLNLNVDKTKWMLICKDRNLRGNVGSLRLDNKEIERVQSYKYLGCFVNDNWDNMQEIRSRIEQARASFVKMKPVLCNRSVSLSTRLRVLRCYVFSVLFHGSEAWTLTEAMCKKLEAFEMWTYRRMLRISWMDRVRNTEVLARMGKDTEVLFTLKKRKLEYFGHILRNEKYRLPKLVIEGRIEGRRGVGRRRNSWLKNLRQWFGETTVSLFRKAVDKVQIALMIANVRKEHGT